MIKQLFTLLTNKNNEKTDHFNDFFLPKQQWKRRFLLMNNF